MNAIDYSLCAIVLMFFLLYVFFMLVLTPVHKIARTGKVLKPWQRRCETTRVWVIVSMSLLFWVAIALMCVNALMCIIRVSVMRAF